MTKIRIQVLAVALLLGAVSILSLWLFDATDIALVAVTGLVMIARELLSEPSPPMVPAATAEHIIDAVMGPVRRD